MLGTNNITFSQIGGAQQALKSTNGYQKLASGVIIQWGISASLSADSNTTLNFPITFPNTVLNAQATMISSATSNDDTFARVISHTTTQISLRAEWTALSSSGTRYIYYVAIGH